MLCGKPYFFQNVDYLTVIVCFSTGLFFDGSEVFIQESDSMLTVMPTDFTELIKYLFFIMFGGLTVPSPDG